MDIVELVRLAMKEIFAAKDHGFQKATAIKCGVSPGHLNDFLGGRKTLSEKKRAAVIKELGYEYGEFISLAKNTDKIDIESTQQKVIEDVTQLTYEDITLQFENVNWARDVNQKLLEIETIDSSKRNMITGYIDGILSTLKSNEVHEPVYTERRKGKRRTVKQPKDDDRRKGRDRRRDSAVNE